MLPWRADLAGRLEEGVIDSTLLRDNPLGDPHERPVWVYLPPGYDEQRRALPGGLRHPGLHRTRGDVGQPDAVPAAVPRDRRPGVRRRQRPAAASWSSSTRGPPYGGSQFVDSPGTGQYHSYLCDEVVPWVDARYRTIADRESRAITGKSSGGFGAMITPMLRPDLFGALATHAGDTPLRALLHPGLRRGRPAPARATTATSGGGGTTSARAPSFTKAEDAALLTALGCSACFSAGRRRHARCCRSTRAPGVLREDGVAALAGLGPGPDGRPVRRRAALACGRSGSTPAPATTTTSTSARRRSGTGSRGSACRTTGSTSSCSTPPTRAIDYRYPLALAWLAQRLAR